MSTRWIHVIAITGTLLTSLTGCRFGNQIQTAPSPITIRYYETQPQTLQFCAIPTSTASANCQNASVDIIPSLISDVMSNPVALRTDSTENQSHLISLSPYHDYLPTHVSSDNSLSYAGRSNSVQLWDDSDCTTHFELIQNDGKISSLPESTTTTSSGQSVLVSGRIQLTFEVSRYFEGNCEASLQKMYVCYTNPFECGGTDASENLQLQSRVQSFFEDYIQAGVMTVSDIRTVTAVGYSVSYR